MREGPAGPVRDWLAWSAVWTLALQSPMWIAVGIDSVQERSDPTMEATPVAGWVPVLGTGLAVAVPVAFLLSVLGARLVRPRRTGLVLGGVSLLVAALAWSGFPENDTGQWYVALSALAGVVCLLAALVPGRDGDEPQPRWVRLVVAGALLLAGVFTAWTCWRGGAYWHWRGSAALTYRAGVGLGVVQVLLGLLAPWWVPRRVPVLRVVVGSATALAGTFAVVLAASYFLDMGILYRWVEDERAWDMGTPSLVAGVGLLATATAARRGRQDLMGLSLAAATTGGLFALWRESTWGSVMS